MIFSHSEKCRARGAADSWQLKKSSYFQSLDEPVVVNWLKRIESILRNGLPHSDKDVAETIAHAHSEIELLLESIDEDWWMQ